MSESISSPKPPHLMVKWHHLERFRFEDRPLIWVTIANMGGPCTLFTFGEIKGKGKLLFSLGMGQYDLSQNETIELGFFRSEWETLTITEDKMRNWHLIYCVYLIAVNEDGHDTFFEEREIPVVSPSSSSSSPNHDIITP